MHHDADLRLDSFHLEERKKALAEVFEKAQASSGLLPPFTDHFNLHCHSFYSFNGYGFSPSHLAWQGRKLGLRAMAMVDFDVLDGADEFLEASRFLGMKAGVGMETRVFVPEFAQYEINSPGEPGVAYHIGLGFTSSRVKDPGLLSSFKDKAQARTRAVVNKVNTLLQEIALDYEKDVLSLTPAGNATERHVCAAYYLKSLDVFPDAADLHDWWARKLDLSVEETAASIASPPVFQAILRSKTMKQGGVGYIPCQGEDFPVLKEVNRFILDNGAIPVLAFLDGTSSGEERMEDLLEVMMDSGVSAVNIIPDRNWNIKDPQTRALKVRKLAEFIQQARDHHLPIIVGTEMNAHGQVLVDGFDSAELRPYFQDFEAGMYFLHGHSVLQALAGLGHSSEWASTSFKSREESNRFYSTVGEMADPAAAKGNVVLSVNDTPGDILRKFSP
ncbi:MAG: hypothetical protein GX130_11005 [Candidatus Hydrogenedens sp.]|jgi:hypothetical protein|nr:hypothetical protein [Candidatus Hydrogenedens sp.]